MGVRDTVALLAVLALTPLQIAATTSDTDWQPASTPDGHDTFVVLESEEGDHIGQGRNWEYTLQTARMVAYPVGEAPVRGVRIAVSGDERWQGQFEAPDGEPIEEGVYDGATRTHFTDEGEPGIEWSGGNRSCESSSGWFVIDELSFDDAGDVRTLQLRFEQNCGNDTGALRGMVRIDTTAPAPAPLNPRPIPDGLWTPDPALIPSTDGPVVVLESEDGDYIGGGGRYAYSDDQVRIHLTDNYLIVGADSDGGAVTWSGDFVGRWDQPRLEVGLYDDLQRYPFHNPALGGLNWGGNHRGCNELVGWFAIDEIAYTPDGALERLALRFTQHCSSHSDTPPLHGYVSVGVAAPDVTPPTVTVSAGPDASTRHDTATLEFTADEDVRGFECRLGSDPWVACASPWTISDLGEGDHRAEIRATDLAGNTSSAVTWTWTVDQTPPSLTITDGPDEQTAATTARFEFTADEPATFSCRLDDGPWQDCSSPWSLRDLEDGQHVVQIRGTDAAGNTSETSDRSWLVCSGPVPHTECWAADQLDALPLP